MELVDDYTDHFAGMLVAANGGAPSFADAIVLQAKKNAIRAALKPSPSPVVVEPTDDALSTNDIAQIWLARGYRIVPAVPTDAMLKAMAFCDGYPLDSRERPGLTRWEDYWLAALAALNPKRKST